MSTTTAFAAGRGKYTNNRSKEYEKNGEEKDY
jgi:hypothetical protein